MILVILDRDSVVPSIETQHIYSTELVTSCLRFHLVILDKAVPIQMIWHLYCSTEMVKLFTLWHSHIGQGRAFE